MISSLSITHDLLPGLKHAQLSEPDMERGGDEVAVLVLDDDDVDSPGEGGAVDLAVPLLQRPDEGVGQAPAHPHWLEKGTALNKRCENVSFENSHLQRQ